MKKILSIVLMTTFAVFFLTASVGAVAAKNPLAATNGKTKAATNRSSVATAASTTGQTVAAGKLADTKLKVCQNKETAILKRNTQLTKMAENMIIKFDDIATKVETYYTDKVVPSGKTVANYDDLVAEIATKKTTVQTDLNKASANASAFKCSSDDPKGQLTQFRTDMQTVKQSLKEYRTSIKNLIVAIRSITGTTASSSANQ